MNFLTGMAFWQIIVLLIIIIMAIFTLTFFIIFLINKFKLSIKTSFGEVSYKKEKKNENIKTNKNELIFIRKKEFEQIINRAKDSMNKMVSLMKIEKLEKQMKFAEETLLGLILETEKKFIDFLKARKKFNFVDEDVKKFNSLLKITYDRILDILKDAFKNNGFEKITGGDLDNYIDRKLSVAAKAMKDVQTDYLIPFNIISTLEFNDFMTSCSSEQKKVLINIFRNAQKEYYLVKDKVLKEDLSLNDFIWSIANVEEKK